MANGLVITFAALHFERQFFLAANVFHHVGDHSGTRDSGCTDREFALIIDKQDAIKSVWFARLGLETFNLDLVTRSDAILFATSF